MKRAFLVFFLVMTHGLIHAQSGADLDRMLLQKEVNWSDAATWTFASAGAVYQNPADAVYFAASIHAIPQKVHSNDPADLAGLSLLIMRAYDMRGGIFYSLFRNRRYAFRELIFLGVLEKEDMPQSKFSGAKFLSILSKINRITSEQRK